MNSEPSPILIEELKAGHALADLDSQELSVWRDLAQSSGIARDEQMEWIVAQLEIEAAWQAPEAVPIVLVETLTKQAREFLQTPGNTPIEKTNTTSSSRAWRGWAVAAGLAIFLVAQSLTEPKTSASRASIELSRTLFLQQSPDVIHLPFAGTSGAYASTAGEVQWSDQKQQGYLVLENLPANDPTQQQYQLWIVDPQRDEIPVDGGLFDVVSPTPETVVIEIHAKLAIQRPKAFVITVEQPGGVVRSKQKIVVGIAKALP
jgi:hypothetical protein